MFNDAIICPTSYPKRVKEIGCIPFGLFFPKGKFIEEAADLCDAFIITGGKDVESVGINLVHYAIKNNKPLLGICLGMQTMAAYEWTISKLSENATYEEIDHFYKKEYQRHYLDYINNHDKLEPFDINKIEETKHDVHICDKNSKLYNIFKQDIIYMPSLHKETVNLSLKLNNFRVVGKGLDDSIEAIEYKGTNLILGVQFHPELDKNSIKIFKALRDSI